jgi:hypothetical protein
MVQHVVLGATVVYCAYCGNVANDDELYAELRAGGHTYAEFVASMPEPIDPPVFRPVGKDDHVMTLAEFDEAVASGSFIDYDGYGAFVKDGQRSNREVWLSLFKELQKAGKVPAWATHVVWFNR